MDATYQEIAEALAVYFDGFYEGDIDKLKRIFHPSAHLFSATDGPLADDPIENKRRLNNSSARSGSGVRISLTINDTNSANATTNAETNTGDVQPTR